MCMRVCSRVQVSLEAWSWSYRLLTGAYIGSLLCKSYKHSNLLSHLSSPWCLNFKSLFLYALSLSLSLCLSVCVCVYVFKTALLR